MAPVSQLRKRAAEAEMENPDESFVKIGTPLPALSSKKTDINEFLPVWQQEVKDEQGRRRLHGAFTGGFSAGYFNTVGSKEGWAPAEFKSSRSEKKKQASQDHRTLSGSRPEDFMDAEDLAELESSKELKTKSQFDSIIGESHAPSTFSTPHYDPLAGHLDMSSDPMALNEHIGPSRAGPALSDLIQPTTSRIGHQLMQKMGWRHGQGIGPRITFERRRQLAQNYGIPMTLADDEDDAEMRKHLFPPPDRPLSVFQTRSGNAGLGYSKNDSLQLDPPFSQAGPSAESVADVAIAGQMMPKGASFGLGALNEFEDDDHDIYDAGVNEISSDPRAQRLLGLEDVNTFNRPSASHSQPSSSQDRLVPPGRNTFTDGTRVFKGFRLPLASPQSGTQSDDTRFSGPAVPDDWVPDPSKVWASLCPNSREAESNLSSRNLPKPLSASDRGRLLGEKQPPKSVFDFISAKEKARLQKVKQQMSSLPLESAAHMSSQAEFVANVPTLPPTIAQAALRGFMPFSHDLLKQQRYRLYLQSQAGMLPEGAVFSPQPKPGESVDQINKELEGFAKSAMMFKPMSAMMASRFVSAASSTANGELATPQPGLRQPVFSEEQTVLPGSKSAADSSPSAKPEEALSEAAQAVRMDMFGMLTRITATFYPQKLLCKRFNVPNPFPHGEPTLAKTNVPANRMADFLTAHGFQPATSDTAKAKLPDGKHGSDDWITRTVTDGPPKPLDQVGLGDDETQGRDILTTTRPAIDLFKAIFADDSEEDVDTEAEEKLISTYKDTPMSPKRFLSETAQNGSGSIDTSPPTNPTVMRPMSVSIPSLTPKIVDPNELGKLASFRPTFSRKADQSIDIMTDKDDSVRKQKKKSKKRNALVSFEDEDAEPIKDVSKVKKKKSRQTMEVTKSSAQKDKHLEAKIDVTDVPKKSSACLDLGTAGDLDDEWVEKPAALAVIPNSNVGRPDPTRLPQMKIETRPPTNEARSRRPRACDLMDD